MLVYGDVERIETVRDKQKAIEAHLDQMNVLPPGSARHAVLVAAFIDTSELIQALVDADFQARGFDTLSPVHVDGLECLSLLAHSIVQSWQSGFAQGALPETFRDKVLSFDAGLSIRTKQAEGYAFYALYPESYVEAAARSGLGPQTRVIGIRSIGAGLASLVAAALGTRVALTVRPVGHPFRREITVDPETAAMLTRDPGAPFAIVDEGPGLSGSSFGAVADWLEAAGIPRERIHFFPSHAGPLGPQAGSDHRERWVRAPRHFIGMDQLLCDRERSHLRGWVESLVGPLDGDLQDISGGAWRTLRYQDPADWPPTNMQQERRKFLARAEGATWLVKFAGLGESGLRKYALARQLHQAGFTPDVAGYRHGFLVERWHESAPSLDRIPIGRDRLVSRIGIYLGFRARHCPAQAHQGASLIELRNMALYNAEQALGERAGAALSRVLQNVDDLSLSNRILTDNRMQPWEWLLVDGRAVKADALDHCATHDLIGCQDITWDIAGAAVEFGLSDQDTRRLCALVQEESARPVSLALLSFMLPCYLAFQLGANTMAADAVPGSAEEDRLRHAAQRYGALLQGYLEHPGRLGFGEEQDKVPAG
ncbi:hypothetical protein [Microvirga makkahensis]|uniref:Uncharacterized protein n=1 Tax=Microvirga makkahensis TaxID=1128670 RepID=A0A7X3MQM9_9HYPH|nr:hypothetical protein [Microvirga makkahensis]MXQ11426.1 hypothetical protein [Microvirga makkahensis]